LDVAWGQLKDNLKRPWVPDVLAYADHLARPEQIKSAAAERLANAGPFDPAVVVEVPKSPLITRNGVLLSVEDFLAYHSAIESIAGRVDRQLSAAVFSYRLDESGRGLFRSPTGQWLKWAASVTAALNDGSPWMIATDIVSYFDAIQHRPLFAAIDFLNVDQNVSASLKRMVSFWANETGVGIPQGPDVSAVLGNLYLVPVDNAMESDDWLFFRYMDDIRIVARSRGAVLAGLRVLERECRKLGLMLALAKTKQLHGDEAVKSLQDTRLDAAAYAWNARDFFAAKAITRRVLRQALVAGPEVEARLLRFTLYRLASLRDNRNVDEILARLEYLGHVAPDVARYLWHWVDSPSTTAAIGEFLCDRDRNTSPVLASWLLAAFVDKAVAVTGSLATYVRRTMKDSNQPKYLRVLAANLLAIRAQPADLAWLRSQLVSEYDPFLLRGLIVASSRAGDLNAAAVKTLAKRAPNLMRTLDYVRERQALPSLVYQRAPGRPSAGRARPHAVRGGAVASADT